MIYKVIIFMFFITACRGRFIGTRQTINELRKDFPNAIIYNIPCHQFNYIIIDSVGNVYDVKVWRDTYDTVRVNN